MIPNKSRQRLLLALISAATILGASACGSAATATNSPSAPSAATSSSAASMSPDTSATATASTAASTGTAVKAAIQIKSFAYTGPDSVKAGATVTVTNKDAVAHTLTADDGSFNAVVEPGASVTFTAPTKPGAYTYHCKYHASMHGTLNVK
ncbi:cupredoxin domain-containing protein [Arthrobacter dokdonensis]|uniref:cupredoxin domain-containing protein n=1 Tax=Arthrobacter dokdonellae TaxID=2211210 RepID=UPI001D130ADA|nr:cupredoxin domain-containing protein [Arthrobacter dokdonellae]